MKSLALNMRGFWLVLTAVALFGGLFAGALAFTGTPVMAQSTDGDSGEMEANGAEDANEDPDVPITGTALEAASAAALDYLGEGRVTDSEVGDEEGYYEVEITRDNGRQVDVHLDMDFNVIDHEND